MGTRYYATVKVEVPRVIRCDHCRQEFLYLMRKTGTGVVEPFLDISPTTSSRQAEEMARRHLAEQLTPDNFNVVPCRHCFRYPSFMRERAAKLRYGNGRYIGFFLGCFSVVVLVFGVGMIQTPQVYRSGVWVTVVGSVGILLGCLTHWFVRRLIAAYDPNSQPEQKRRKLVDERCKTWNEFNREQAERLAREYQVHAEEQKRGPWRVATENAEPRPPAQLWLGSKAFLNGLSLPLQLAADREVMVEVVPDVKPGTVIDLVPGDRNERPFQVVLLPVSDYYNDPLDDGD